MKPIVISLFLVIASLSGFSQSYFPEGDSCFDNGHYACAITNYEKAFNSTSGKEKQIAEIKLTRAKWCITHMNVANEAFNKKNYSIAKEEYQKVVDSNPKDSYAREKIQACEKALNPPKLRKATTEDLTDIWNNKYGVNPQRRQNLINAGIDPDDAQKRINEGEGKPQEKQLDEIKKQPERKSIAILAISDSIITFNSWGGTSKKILIYTDKTYFISPEYLPSWFKVLKYSDHIMINCQANNDNNDRRAWFKVIADGKEAVIYVNQLGLGKKMSNKQSVNKAKYSCWNCPKAQNTWGFTLGFTNQMINDYSKEVIQFGIKAEPLFKYGFGLNTGLNLFAYSDNLYESIYREDPFEAFAINLPIHLEYRLNFSKWFNIFAYGGFGINILTQSDYEYHPFPVTLDYGCGMRINHVQFNVGKNEYYGNLNALHDFGKFKKPYQNLIFSFSYMF